MDRVEQYRKYVQDLITEHSHHKSTYGDVEMQIIFDKEHEHYQLVHASWYDEKRMYGCLMHIDIKDGTEIGTANQLVEMGVPKEDIILAFYPPYKRPYTGFGVN